jgi:hypothetical protein
MHFRIRTNAIQLIRTTYDAEQKRGKNEVVGTVSRRNLTLSEEVAGKLTPEEKESFEAFVTTYRNTKSMQAKVHAFQLSDIVQQAIEAAEGAEGAEQEMIIANLTGAAQEIRSFLNKRQKAA